MDVFVYGTLTNPERVREVLDSFVFVGPAVLDGLRVVDGKYPTLAPAEGADSAGGRDGGATGRMDGPAVAGRLLRTDEVDALDAYERVEDGLYVRVSVPLVADGASVDGPADGAPAGGDREAAVYVGDPDRLDAAASWPGTGPFPERVRAAVADRPIRVTRPSVD
ncbi:gamma-glutamylcyclotransferase family protein [Halorarum halobium]|uniref:gamma-glutamylcyclotransferase family protein n=1 Tax=Halorarum halobium TaxID=3075121 RepID=UPI0028A5E383|nr:gamma-glutamylcyclotransferase family protein [Halobaculum sp. XH14]